MRQTAQMRTADMNIFLLGVHTTTIIYRATGAETRQEMTQGKVEICGVNTSKLPLLKAEE